MKPLPAPLVQKDRWIAYGYLALSMTLVGTYVALSKPLVAALSVFLLGWMRFGISALAMPHWLKRPAGEPPMTAHTRWLLFLESLIGNFLFTLCMLYGISLTTAVSAGIIMASIPAVVALMSWVFLKERISPRVWVAVAFGAGGIGLLALSKGELSAQYPRGLEPDLTHNSTLLGNLLLCAAVVCEATYAVIGKKLTHVLAPKRITALINAWGFVLMTPFGLWAALHFDFKTITAPTWLLIVFYAMAASVWTVWLWMTGLKTVPAARAGVFTVMLPIAAATVGVVVLGESFGMLHGLAFAFALGGVVLATLPDPRQSGSERGQDH